MVAQIPLSGSIGVPGSAYILGYSSVSFASNGPHTLTAAEYSSKFLLVTSSVPLTLTQNLIGPLNVGQEFVIQNNTTGGQSIQIIGISGTGVTIPNGATVSVVCDGTKYLNAGGGGAVSLGGDLSGTTSSAVVVSAQNGYIVFNPTSIEFASSVAAPEIYQAGTSSGAGANLTIAAQATSASLDNGGNLILSSGAATGGGTDGSTSLAIAGTAGLTLKPTGLVTIPNLTLGVVHADANGNLTSSPVVDADVSGAAAIQVSKLIHGTAGQVLLNNGSAIPTWTSTSGDVTLSNAGVFTVTALQDNPVESGALGVQQDGYVLTWSGTEWAPAAITNGSVTLGGDVTGPTTSNTVVALYNNALASTSPVASAVPVWDVGLTHYDIRRLTQDDILPGFSITSFSGSQTVEVGATVTNPAFTASYSSLPASAQITNTDAIDSPLTLTTPFTSGTVIGSFHHATQTSVTFTLTAVGSSTKTANTSINYLTRSFAGPGTPGATSTVTVTGSNTAMLSTGDILANEGLFSSVVGQTFTITPSNQSVYLLLPTGSYSFWTNSSEAFPFVFNAPTAVSFTNFQGAVISMQLYQSTNTLTGTFTVYIS